MSNISTNVAVTGANGFVGKNVRKFLYKNKVRVLGISRKNFVSILPKQKLNPKIS